MSLFRSLVLSVVLACQSLPVGTPSASFSDSEACVVGILATSQGTPDLGDLLKCGLAVADVWNLVVKLDQPSGDAAAALSPAAASWHAKLQGVKAQIQSLDGGLPHTSDAGK